VEMVANDLDQAKQHALLHKHGYSVAVGKEWVKKNGALSFVEFRVKMARILRSFS
jgi:hypothetical protein